MPFFSPRWPFFSSAPRSRHLLPGPSHAFATQRLSSLAAAVPRGHSNPEAGKKQLAIFMRNALTIRTSIFSSASVGVCSPGRASPVRSARGATVLPMGRSANVPHRPTHPRLADAFSRVSPPGLGRWSACLSRLLCLLTRVRVPAAIVGANDGIYLSNLLFFEAQLGWQGICIEGSPSTFRALQRNRPWCDNVNAVIQTAAPGTTKRFLTFGNAAGMSCMEGFGNWEPCLSLAAAHRYGERTRSKVSFADVPVLQLHSLFRAHGMTDIELGWLMVDVEGAEDLIFKTIHFNETRARFISYEARHPKTAATLTANGYYHTGAIGGIDELWEPSGGLLLNLLRRQRNEWSGHGRLVSNLVLHANERARTSRHAKLKPTEAG